MSLTKDCAVDEIKQISCIIENCYNIKDHTEYILRVKSCIAPDKGHEVSKRYSDFAALDSSLRSYGINLPLPPKKVFGKMDTEFIEGRQDGLQNYLNAALNHLWVPLCLETKTFLFPEAYLGVEYNATALQNVSMLLRSESKWTVNKVLPNIGWRLGKCFMTVTDCSRPKEKFLLAWCTSGPDRTLDDRELELAVKVLSNLQHPGIDPVLFATCNRKATVFIRQFHERGTLRDVMCNSKPSLHFMKKYGNPKTCGIIVEADIRVFGRQILEALKFLHDKGFPYVDLHSGNVICRDSKCVLVDLENSILGLGSINRRWYTQLRKLQTPQAVEVYCFGRLLYEMTTGRPLERLTCDITPHGCTSELKSVLEMVVSTTACKSTLPSVDDLLQHPFFAEVDLTLPVAVEPRLSTSLVKSFEAARTAFIQRVNEEQRTISQYRRFEKAQAFHMSEEERRKRKLIKMKSLNESSSSKAVLDAADSMRDISLNDSPVTPAQCLPVLLEQVKDPPATEECIPPSIAEIPATPGRANLLMSVTSFNKSGLRRVQSVNSAR